jgi:predicted transposase YbfD/YdcC
MISQIPGGADGVEQLVCDGKTLRGSAIKTEEGNHRFVAQVTVYARALGVALAQKAFDTHESSERAALKELLSGLKLEGVVIKAARCQLRARLPNCRQTSRRMRCIRRRRFSMVLLLRRRLRLRPGGRRVPDDLAEGFSEGVAQPTHLRRQVACQFDGKRHIPFLATDHEKRHGHDTIWTLRAKEAPHHIKEKWPGSAWIVEVIADTTTRKGKRELRQHLFLTSLRTAPEALLRLIRQRWSIENEWHWARDVELGPRRSALSSFRRSVWRRSSSR